MEFRHRCVLPFDDHIYTTAINILRRTEICVTSAFVAVVSKKKVNELQYGWWLKNTCSPKDFKHCRNVCFFLFLFFVLLGRGEGGMGK